MRWYVVKMKEYTWFDQTNQRYLGRAPRSNSKVCPSETQSKSNTKITNNRLISKSKKGNEKLYQDRYKTFKNKQTINHIKLHSKRPKKEYLWKCIRKQQTLQIHIQKTLTKQIYIIKLQNCTLEVCMWERERAYHRRGHGRESGGETIWGDGLKGKGRERSGSEISGWDFVVRVCIACVYENTPNFELECKFGK